MKKQADSAPSIPAKTSAAVSHTPGEWTNSDGFEIIGPFKNGFRAIVCDCSKGFQSQSEKLANARLIAAAPVLLSALVALLEQADLGEVDEETAPIVAQARAAIQSATL